jgi:hypothetical protein
VQPYGAGQVRPKQACSSVLFWRPELLAVTIYFADALEYGFDGRFLRRLAGLVNPVASDIRPDEIDAAFREMGVAAPVPKDEARLVLATEAAKRAIAGESNVFDEATHIRIHLCEWDNAPRWRWHQLEKELRDAMSKFLITRQ